MTKNELCQLYWLKKEISALEGRIEVLRTKCEKNTSTLTGMPRGSLKIDLKDEMIDLIKLLECKKQQRIIEQSRIERYINSISDSQIRTIMSFRFIDCLTWQQIAFNIGEHDESYPRRKCNAYLKRAENAEFNMV